MPRVVLDTNVLVSALLFGGVPGTILQLVADGALILVTSPILLTELERVLISKFDYPPTIAELITTELRSLGERVDPTLTLNAIRQDPSDNRVLECAVSAQADAIVSGDRHLLILKTFRGIPILSPQAFLTAWREKRL